MAAIPPPVSHRLPLSGVIISKNEADRIERCVLSLIGVCAEVIVLDSGSSDQTVALAQHAGARVEHQDWLGFSAQKNAVIALARQPWVLLLDADEWLGAGAEAGLRRLFAQRQVETADIWRLQRRTHFLGQALNHGGWGREAVQRLFRAELRYLAANVHEKLDARDRRQGSAHLRIEHDTARSEAEYRGKLQHYARLWAAQKHREQRTAGALAPSLHAAAYWLKNYLLRAGFLDGRGGWRYHACHARYVFDKYQALRGLNRQRAAS